MQKELDNSSLLRGDTREFVLDYLTALGGPTALGLKMCISAGDDISAATHTIDPRDYSDPDDFRAAYLAVAVLAKYQVSDPALEKQRQDAALKKFFACEEQLRPIASRLRCADSAEADVFQVLRLAREKISSILGSASKVFNVADCSFGPGSSSSVPRSKAHPSRKFVALDVSAACAPMVSWFFCDANIPRPFLNLVEHSKLCFVPKNFKIDRIIATEPDWNIFIQKGIGAAIRKCLRRAGLDLNNCAEKHGQLARIASLLGNLATIDFSSASDCLSVALIRYLLPRDWFFLLNSARTDSIQIGDQCHHLRKFSSMGNGFTFELESLVFYAFAKACCALEGAQASVSVFGDDVIIPVEQADLFIRTLTHFGFSINTEKTFVDSYFRESCGAHYFKGVDVKPLYLKKELTNDPERFKVCNGLRRLAYRSYHDDVFNTVLRSPYNRCKHRIRRKFYIPEGYGDAGLVSTFDEATTAGVGVSAKNRPVRRHPDCIEGYKVKCLLPVARVEQEEGYGMLIHKLRTLGSKTRSMWVHSDLPVFRLARRDLGLIDKRPETGNDISLAVGKAAWRVGHMHVVVWTEPGTVKLVPERWCSAD